MLIPTIPLTTVYHVGTLAPADVGRNSGAGRSQEGNGLSVSLCPDAWTGIVKLGGNETFEMTASAGRFLDVHAVLEDPNLSSAIIEWAIANGMAHASTLWKVWSTDEDGEWRYSTFATRDEAVAEATYDFDEEELEAPEGHAPIEPVEGLVAGSALRAATGMDLGADDDALDACIVAYAKIALPALGIEVDGVWWREMFDPAALSAPRGCIFPEKVTNWTAAIAAPADDLDRLDEMPETIFAEALRPVPGPGWR